MGSSVSASKVSYNYGYMAGKATSKWEAKKNPKLLLAGEENLAIKASAKEKAKRTKRETVKNRKVHEELMKEQTVRHAENIAVVSNANIAARAALVAALVANQEQNVAQLIAKQAEWKQSMDQKESQCKKYVADKDAYRKAEKEQQEKRHKHEVERMKKEHTSALQVLKTSHAAAIAAKNKIHAEILAEMEQLHAKAVLNKEQQHAKAMLNKEKQYGTVKKITNSVNKVHAAEQDAHLTELTDRHEAAMKAKQTDHEKLISQASEEHTAKIEKLKAEAAQQAQQHEEEMAQVNFKHAAEMNALQQSTSSGENAAVAPAAAVVGPTAPQPKSGPSPTKVAKQLTARITSKASELAGGIHHLSESARARPQVAGGKRVQLESLSV